MTDLEEDRRAAAFREEWHVLGFWGRARRTFRWWVIAIWIAIWTAAGLVSWFGTSAVLHHWWPR